MSKNRIILFIFLFIVFIYIYIITDGDMNLFRNEALGCTYTSMLDKLKRWEFDVDPACISNEAFIINGKTYTYFGVFPALLRGFIELFFERNGTDWSRISTLIGVIAVVFFSFATYCKINSQVQNSEQRYFIYKILFLFIIAFSSPLQLLLSSSYLFHETLSWGMAWSSVFMFTFTNFIVSQKTSTLNLLMMSLSVGFALMSRVTFVIIIFPFLLLLAFICFAIKGKSFNIIFMKNIFNSLKLDRKDVSKDQWKRNMIFCIVPLVFCLCFCMKVNNERWGSPFLFSKFEYHNDIMNNQFRLQKIKESPVYSLLRLPYSLSYYFIPTNEVFQFDFPFVKITTKHIFYDFLRSCKITQINSVYFDGIESLNPISLNSLPLFILSIVGTYSFFTFYPLIYLLILIPYFAQAFLSLLFFGITLRYEMEFLPFLILSSIFSFKYLEMLESRYINKKLWIRLLIIFVSLIGIFINFGTMLQYKLWMGHLSSNARERIITLYKKVERCTDYFK